MRLIVVVLLAVLLAPAPVASAGAPVVEGVHVADGELVDALGRRVILRGINAMDKVKTKGSDDDLDPDLTDADLERIAAIGFNVLRLGTSWNAIEPVRGSFDDAFIDRFRSVMDRAHDHGLLVVVDMHQDVWSEYVGSNGAPEWAGPQCNVPPRIELAQTTGQWWMQYFSPDSQAAFTNFWADGAGDVYCTGPVQTSFVEMWGHLASRLTGHPALAGYDLFNEPWPGTPPGAFEVAQLYPFYERVADAIREHDPDTPIFFEPSIQRSAMLPSVPAGPPDPNSVYAPHLYTETMYSQGQLTTGGITDDAVLAQDTHEAAVMGVPTWIGEWGAFENEASADYQRQVYDTFDRHRIGSAYWHYTQGYSDGLKAEGPQAEAAHVRVYPEAYPGEARWRFDPDTRTFAMSIDVPEDAAAVSVVVPTRLYPDGPQVTAGGAVSYDPATQRLAWSPPDGTGRLIVEP